MTVTGECFCGKVTYQIDAPLRDARSCHCSRCRKIFSAQASAYAEVAPGAFTWLTGEDLLNTFDTGNGFGVRFCGNCGSTMVGVHQGEVHGVTLGCVNGDPDVEIGMHIFVGSKAAWEKLPENVVQFEEGPPKESNR